MQWLTNVRLITSSSESGTLHQTSAEPECALSCRQLNKLLSQSLLQTLQMFLIQGQ